MPERLLTSAACACTRPHKTHGGAPPLLLLPRAAPLLSALLLLLLRPLLLQPRRLRLLPAALGALPLSVVLGRIRLVALKADRRPRTKPSMSRRVRPCPKCPRPNKRGFAHPDVHADTSTCIHMHSALIKSGCRRQSAYTQTHTQALGHTHLHRPLHAKIHMRMIYLQKAPSRRASSPGRWLANTHVIPKTPTEMNAWPGGPSPSLRGVHRYIQANRCG